MALAKTDNCFPTRFQIPLKDSFKFERSRYFRFQINEFYGKGGGLRFLKLDGSRLGICPQT